MLSPTLSFLTQHKKYAPVAFFIGGFVWDSLTLGRIDSWYSNLILLTYLVALSVSIYTFNLADSNRSKGTYFDSARQYAPLAIQFFFGGLSSAYVIFFFQSVSFTKTIVFFVILVFMLVSNEVFKHRISNRYFQFAAYYFVTFTFFIFFLPVMLGVMSTLIFILAGFISLGTTYYFIRLIIQKNPDVSDSVSIPGLGALIMGVYLLINVFYYLNLIPPVPLSLQTGLVAYDVHKENNSFIVTYDTPSAVRFWQAFDSKFSYTEGDTIYIYTSIFAPANLTKAVQHRWKWYNPSSDTWNTTDEINYNVVGGRKKGYRGYTYKTNVIPGLWRVDVITREGLVLGEINFEVRDDTPKPELSRDLTSEIFD